MNVTHNVRSILTVLPALSKEEVSQVYASIVALHGKIEERDAGDSGAAIVYNAAVAALKILTKDSYPESFHQFKHSRTKKELEKMKQGYRHVMQFIDRLFPNESRSQKVGLLNILVRAVVHDLHDNNLRLSWSNIIVSLQEIEMVIDNQFPGYMQAGLLKPILLARIRGETPCLEPTQSANLRKSTPERSQSRASSTPSKVKVRIREFQRSSSA